MRVALCIITYRRPKGLRRLLEGLDELRFEEAPPDVEVIVVDNDAAGQACRACEDVSLRWPLRCVVEPRQGIPQARNRAVREADDASFIAFIDDDEVPAPQWLDELLRVQQQTHADVVSGPVLPRFGEYEHHWLSQGGFFTGPRYATGAPLWSFATGNVLIRTSLLRERDQPFDERLRFTGGTDLVLARQLHRENRSMVWADDAIVFEHIPETRLRPHWVMQRAFRGGNTLAITERFTDVHSLMLFLRTLKGLWRILQGFLTILLRLPAGRTEMFRAALICSKGAGEIAGALGWFYEEYNHRKVRS